MPIYEYHCLKCSHLFEEIRKFSQEDKDLKCPKCEMAWPERKISKTSPPKFIGKGFYQTDYGGKSPK